MISTRMITKEFNLSDKTVIAINMKNQTGRPNVTGMFYVYDNEELAKKVKLRKYLMQIFLRN